MFQGIILGTIQGLTEFLPISSSAHLIVARWLFGWKDLGLSYDVALHIGTLLAILIYFRQDWINLIRAFWQSITSYKIDTSEKKLAWFVILASIPGAVGGIFLESKAETIFRSPMLVAIIISIFGLILYLIDFYSKKRKKMSDIKYSDAFFVGFMQLLAVIPGVSRSGGTITGGLICGLKREDAVKFSFLLSAPIMAGAGLLELHKIIKEIDFSVILACFFSMFIGMICINFLLKYIRKNNFLVFTIYRILLAIGIISYLKFR